MGIEVLVVREDGYSIKGLLSGCDVGGVYVQSPGELPVRVSFESMKVMVVL